MIELNWPWVFILIPLPLLAWLSVSGSQHLHTAIKVPPGVSTALEQTRTHQKPFSNIKTIRLLLLAIAWLALLTAIAQPYKATHHSAQPASGRALSVLIDLSTSMERKDFSIQEEAVDRLTVVKLIASQFIANRSGDRVGLVLFGSEAFIASPLSYDLNSVNTILQSSGIGMAGRTTAMGDALGLAIQSLREDPAVDKAIVLLSDGTNNAGSVEPEDAAALARELGIVVHTIGLGSDNTTATQQFQSAAADLDEQTLRAVASSSGGQFFRAQTTEELDAIYREIDQLTKSNAAAPPLIIKQDYRNLFILITLLCILLVLLLRAVKARMYRGSTTSRPQNDHLGVITGSIK